MHSPNVSCHRSSKRARVSARHVPPSQLIITKIIQEIITLSRFPREVAILKLSDEVLLNIFRHYLDASPRFWLQLVHVCRKWRRIVLASQHALHLRIYCTHGMPALKTLDFWLTLPIVVQYGGSLALDPPTLKDEDNIMAALKQSGRVSSISLTVKNSLLEKLSAIEGPFSELEDLDLLSQDSVQLTLPSTFQWGPRLRSLCLTRTTFLALPQLLYSSRELVYLELHEVLNPWRTPPEALTEALSRMTQLQSFSLHFPPTTDYFSVTPPSGGKRVILPALTRFNFRGTSRYLGTIVTRIDTPRLRDLEVTLFDAFVIDLDLSKLIEFIHPMEIRKSLRRAHILSSDSATSISLIQPGAPTCFKLQIFSNSLSDQLLSIARICVRFSSFLVDVEDLRISTMQSSGLERIFHTAPWLEPINLFTGVKWFHLDGCLSTHIVRALQIPDGRQKSVLPALQKLYIPQLGPRHAPLREALVSFMTSRWLSGNHIAVEYERPCRINELCGAGPFSRQVTIEMLSDDILLEIFRHFLGTSPQIWPMLTHVCQRWRQIAFASPLGLNLRLYCTYGTPVSKALDCWPPLPIVVHYGGFPNLGAPAPEDDDNIIAALKQTSRVSSINLTVTSSLLEKLPTITEPISELEELTLLSQDNVQLTILNTLRWGLRLRTLHSTRVAFPSLPQLLTPSLGLVDLQLREIPSADQISPEAFANALSGMSNLRTLSLHFLSLPPRRKYLALPPQLGERVVLPALECLKYRGTSKYLDIFVTKIDAHRLKDIDISFFSQPTMDASELGRFIERTEMRISLTQAEVRTSAHAISMSFTSSGTSTPLQLQILCKQVDWQLSSMAQICNQFSPFLFRVKNLAINPTEPSSGRDDVGGRQWLELLRAFDGTRDLRVAGESTTTEILCALGTADGGHTAMLPALRHLRVEKTMAMNGLLWDGVRPFITSRRLSDRPVKVHESCHICYASFTGQQGLKTHLVDKHAYQIVCFYCGDFEWLPGYDDLFREHLIEKHLETPHADPLISDPVTVSHSISSPNSIRHRIQRNDLCASDIFELYTKLMAPDVSRSETPEDFETWVDSVIQFPPSP